jgi:multidrug efflux pump subunit AcrA (membrane-fusion protein)
MRGSMVLTLAEHSDLLVPRTALVETLDGMALFVVEQNGSTATVRRLEVETETIGPRRVRVRSGLEPGSTVVVQGQYRLADGDAVEIRGEDTTGEDRSEAP